MPQPARQCITCRQDFIPEGNLTDKCLECTIDYYRDMIDILDQVEARDHIERLAEIIVWMSGSADFGPEGQAHEGWRTRGQPALLRAMEFLRKTEPPPRPPPVPAAPRFERDEPL